MNHPRVLVLLAAYNGGCWIGEQIDSILRQEAVDVDVLISDDGSTDDTRDRIRDFASDTRLRLLEPPTPGGSAAQNFLRLIRDEPATPYAFVAFSDQDDIWRADKLSRACSLLHNRAAAGYSSAVTAFWDDGRQSTLRQSADRTRSDFLFEGAGQGCTFVLTREFFERVRVFFLDHILESSALHYHDWAVYALSRSWGLTWIFDPEALVRYRQHARNDTGARATITGVRRRLRLIRDGWYARQLRTIAEICFSAAPDDPSIAEWHRLVGERSGILRRYRIAKFCLRGGRRRLSDNAILIGAALAGWI